MSSTKSIANLLAKLESLTFKEGQDRESRVSILLTIIGELAAQDQNMTDASNVTKIMRTPPPSFDALATALTLNENSFHQMVNAVQADIERRVKIGTRNQN